MGHSQVGQLQMTKNWRAVIALIGGGADVTEVAAATSTAAESTMRDAGNDPGVCHAVWLLMRIPLAARADQFGRALRELGLDVGDQPSIVEICAAATEGTERQVRISGAKSDLSEMAELALVESLSVVSGRETTSLFGAAYAADEARAALHRLGTVKQFGLLARDFFARLTRRYLDYYLSRELPQHVGVSARFHSLRDHVAFEEALDRHCRETAVIVEQYSGEWFSKTNYEGGISAEKVRGSTGYAFKKVRDELRIRREAHG